MKEQTINSILMEETRSSNRNKSIVIDIEQGGQAATYGVLLANSRSKSFISPYSGDKVKVIEVASIFRASHLVITCSLTN